MRTETSTRRMLFARTLAGACVMVGSPVISLSAPSRAEEADETSVALGYKHDTSKIDNKRFPKHAATQRCANCALYQGAASDEWGGCAMFGRKQVAGAGWCTAWVAKPA